MIKSIKKKISKEVLHNRRNYLINSRYHSLLKNFIKKIQLKKDMNNYLHTTNSSKSLNKTTLVNLFYSLIDKAVKKQLLSKKKAAKKKIVFNKKIKML